MEVGLFDYPGRVFNLRLSSSLQVDQFFKASGQVCYNIRSFNMDIDTFFIQLVYESNTVFVTQGQI